MALHFVAGELCRSGQVRGRAGAAVSHLFGVADALGWVLALVPRVAVDRTHLDSPWSVWSLPTHARVATRPRVARRLDHVAVIGHAIALKAMTRFGLRPIAEGLDVPHTTVRTWWQRFCARSPTLVAHCTALAVALDGSAVALATSGERAALDALQVAWQRTQVRFGEAVGDLWKFWSRISGGKGLGTNTTSPWAGGPGADWMAPSHFGGAPP